MIPFRILRILAVAISLGSLLSAKPLNFINIMVDDMGYSDIGCMGGPVETPHLDSLADGGILFTNYRTYPCSNNYTGRAGNQTNHATYNAAIRSTSATTAPSVPRMASRRRSPWALYSLIWVRPVASTTSLGRCPE